MQLPDRLTVRTRLQVIFDQIRAHRKECAQCMQYEEYDTCEPCAIGHKLELDYEEADLHATSRREEDMHGY